MRIKKKQLYLIIENLLFEQDQEDTGYLKQKVEEELNKPQYKIAADTARNLKGAGIQVIDGHPIKSLKQFTQKEEESVKKILSDLSAEERAGFSGFTAKTGRSIGSMLMPTAAGEVGLLSLLQAGSFAAAASAVAAAALEGAAVAAASATLFSSVEAFVEGLDANSRLLKKYKREMMTKLFTTAITSARSQGIVEENFKKRAFSQMNAIVDGKLPSSGEKIADLAVIFSFLTQDDAQKIANDMWDKFLDSNQATGAGFQLSLFFDAASVYAKIFRPKSGVFAQAVRIINNSKKMTEALTEEIKQGIEQITQ